jgi:chemotaxis protein CheC
VSVEQEEKVNMQHPLDILQQVGNTGAMKATASLSALAGKPIANSFSLVRILPIEEVPNLLGDPERIIVGVILEATGDILGRFLVVFPIENAIRLVSTLTGEECRSDGDLGEMELSAIGEVGNILASSYLTALNEMAGLEAMPSPPVLGVDMAGGILTSAVLPLHEAGSEIMFIEAQFGEGEKALGGRMILIPQSESLRLLLKAVKVK